jgi:outer membrane receptor protein involved in Fe transport
VTAPKQTQRRTVTAKPAATLNATPAATAEQVAATAAREVGDKTQTFNQKRDDVLLPKTGTNSYQITQKDIETIPGGSNTQIDQVLLRAPGVTQDSAASGNFHLRNDHANVQFRINGILLPDGVTGFSQFIETSFIGSMALITGALPAQYGLHTTGLVDITTKSGAALQGGSVSVYGGSRQSLNPSFEYGGVTGQTEYFWTGRYQTTNLGLENPTAAADAIHDHADIGKLFGYTSTLLDSSTRLSTIVGVSEANYQIPANPGQPCCFAPGMTAFGTGNFNSAQINQNQYEKNTFAVVAWQRSVENVDVQLSYFSRYNSIHFVPDPLGDLLLNGIASDVYRSTFENGISGDGAYRINEIHTIRAGFFTSGDQTQIQTGGTVEPLNAAGNPIDTPFTINDGSNKFGWLLGGYLQDEWKLTDKLAMNYGARFDQMIAYVDKNQLSPRVNFTYKPFGGTTFHAGYARYFTPPDQALGVPANVSLYNNTTGAVPVGNTGSILPERSHYVDAGVVQQLLPECPKSVGTGLFTKAPTATTNCPSLEVGVSGYYKRSQDLIDDGQFGQAYVLTAFNYEKGENVGIEMKGKFMMGNFTAYTNWAVAHQVANTVVSNQSLFTPQELQYISTNWIATDHSQAVTGSSGISYLWNGTRFSADMIYGSGLRQGFANTDHLPAYGQVNLGISHEFAGWGWDAKPLTVRFDVINVADAIYEIRSGTGIGVFAPQYGPRRGYYMGVSQKF